MINLNVGGTVFATTRATLTKYPDSMLAIMFNPESERPPAEKDNYGNFFIDRDPEPFKVILSFLRNATLDKDIVGCSIEQLEREATYFGLDEILKIIGERKKAKKAEEKKKRAEEEARKNEREKEEMKMKLLDYDVKAYELIRRYREEDEKYRLCPASCVEKEEGTECDKCIKYLMDRQTYQCLFHEYSGMAIELRHSGVSLMYDNQRTDL